MLNMLVSKSKQCDGTSSSKKCTCIHGWKKLRAPPPKNWWPTLNCSRCQLLSSQEKVRRGEPFLPFRHILEISSFSLRKQAPQVRHYRVMFAKSWTGLQPHNTILTPQPLQQLSPRFMEDNRIFCDNLTSILTPRRKHPHCLHFQKKGHV